MLTRFSFKNLHFKKYRENDYRTRINTLLSNRFNLKYLFLNKDGLSVKQYSSLYSPNKKYISSINESQNFYFLNQDQQKIRLFAPHDLNQAIILLHIYLKSENCHSIEKIVSMMNYISKNIYQLEFGREDKINKILFSFFLIFQKFNLNTIESILLTEISVHEILNKIISPSMMEYYTPESCIYALLIINTLNSSIKSKFVEMKFLIQYGISSNSKLFKYLKYGKYIFKETFKTKEKILYRIFINLSTLDNLNLPIKFEVKSELLPYLIYAQYLDVKKNNLKNIEDYIKLLEEYMKTLHSEYNKISINKVEFIPCEDDVYSKLKIFETVIEFFDYKKEYPIIKLISDILISFLRQYRENLNLNQIIILISIFRHDNFINFYDIELFKEYFCNFLLNTFKDKQDILIREISLLTCVDLIYSIDRMFSSDSNKPIELIKILNIIVNKFDIHFSQLIEINFFHKEEFLSIIKSNLIDKDNIKINLFNHITKYYPTSLDLIKKIEDCSNLLEKYRLILYLKFIILYNKNSNQETVL